MSLTLDSADLGKPLNLKKDTGSGVASQFLAKMIKFEHITNDIHAASPQDISKIKIDKTTFETKNEDTPFPTNTKIYYKDGAWETISYDGTNVTETPIDLSEYGIDTSEVESQISGLNEVTFNSHIKLNDTVCSITLGEGMEENSVYIENFIDFIEAYKNDPDFPIGKKIYCVGNDEWAYVQIDEDEGTFELIPVDLSSFSISATATESSLSFTNCEMGQAPTHEGEAPFYIFTGTGTPVAPGYTEDFGNSIPFFCLDTDPGDIGEDYISFTVTRKYPVELVKAIEEYDDILGLEEGFEFQSDLDDTLHINVDELGASDSVVFKYFENEENSNYVQYGINNIPDCPYFIININEDNFEYPYDAIIATYDKGKTLPTIPVIPTKAVSIFDDSEVLDVKDPIFIPYIEIEEYPPIDDSWDIDFYFTVKRKLPVGLINTTEDPDILDSFFDIDSNISTINPNGEIMMEGAGPFVDYDPDILQKLLDYINNVNGFGGEIIPDIPYIVVFNEATDETGDWGYFSIPATSQVIRLKDEDEDWEYSVIGEEGE